MTINARKQQTDLPESHRGSRIQSSYIIKENSLSQIQSNQPEPQLFSLLLKRPKIDQFSTLSSSFTWRKIKYVRSFLYFTALAVFTVF